MMKKPTQNIATHKNGLAKKRSYKQIALMHAFQRVND
jgi:hypothetical protein